MTTIETRISKKGFRISLVKKTNYGVSLFYKNGSESHFYDCKNLHEAEKLYKNGLIAKYQ